MTGRSKKLVLTVIALSIALVGYGNTPDVILTDADLDWLSSASCRECSECGEASHVLIPSPFPWNGRDGDHGCELGTCGVHPMCDSGFAAASEDEDVKATIQAIVDATPAELVALVATYPDRLQINHRRQALQLIGCGSAVVVSYGTMSIPSLEALLD